MEATKKTLLFLAVGIIILLCSTAFTVYETTDGTDTVYELLLAKERSVISCSPGRLKATGSVLMFKKYSQCDDQFQSHKNSRNTNDGNGCSHTPVVSTLLSNNTRLKRKSIKDIFCSHT